MILVYYEIAWFYRKETFCYTIKRKKEKIVMLINEFIVELLDFRSTMVNILQLLRENIIYCITLRTIAMLKAFYLKSGTCSLSIKGMQ